jgi:hypothetical protein
MDTSTRTGSTPGQKIKRFIIKWGFLTALFVVLGFALWSWGSLHFVYSIGERAGFVQKFSKRGWIFKTWEGELAMVNLPGAMPEIFHFTVRDEKVIPSIENTMGNRVVLTYNQHKGLPPRILGDTPYFVTKVRVVVDGGAPTPPATDALAH